jgi:uncharacterized protein (TIGR02301 family)
MNKQIKQWAISVVVVVGSFALSGTVKPSLAQSPSVQQDLPLRDQGYFRNLAELSAVIGAAHAVRVACNGVDDQYWRSYMQQILSLEAPERGPLRARMVDGFNRGYQQSERRNGRCSANSAQAEAEYAREGKRLSDALAAFYFPS